jgi:sugar phosphate permease
MMAITMSLRQRYLQLALISVAGGAIYPLVYMRQNFELSMLEAFGISAAELQSCYALLGALFVLTYLPSGWLADRFRLRYLIAGSLLATGLIGIWFATFPPLDQVRLIFIGWGLSSGLTFWAAMIKAVSLIAPLSAQGRFFGWLEGGRGAVEALLASLAVGLFALLLARSEMLVGSALQVVIWLYAGFSIAVAWPVLNWLNDDDASSSQSTKEKVESRALMADLGLLARNPSLWLAGLVMLSGYQLFWTTYSFSAFIQIALGLSALSAGAITVGRLWMRPIGAIVAGYLSDWTSRQLVLAALLILGATLLLLFGGLGISWSGAPVFGLVLVIGLITYGARGVFWATLADCDVPDRVKGLAIGSLSLICYAPDVIQPLIEASLLGDLPSAGGYQSYYRWAAMVALLGSGLALWLHQRVQGRESDF